jgi:hypothetical protein
VNWKNPVLIDKNMPAEIIRIIMAMLSILSYKKAKALFTEFIACSIKNHPFTKCSKILT